MTAIFGNNARKGLADSQSIEEFNTEVEQFYASLSLEEWRDFVRYFEKSKTDIKHHVIKGADNACELNDIKDKFYNNSLASVSKVVLRTFLCLSSPYLVPEEFIKHKKEFNTENAPLPQHEKTRIRKFLSNVPVDPQSYKSLLTFKASTTAVKKRRSNIERLIDYSLNHCSENNPETGRKSPGADVNEIHNEQQPETGNTIEGLEDVVFIFQESLPEKDESIVRSSVLKSFELINNDDVMPGFSISQYLVKSYSSPNVLPYLVSHAENNLIQCDANCPRYKSEGFCGLCIAVTLKVKCLKSFAYALGKCSNKTTI